MKRKGFTLVELLAVIVVLAVILLIAVPNIMNVINKSKKKTFESSVKMAFKAVEYERLINSKNIGGDLDKLDTFDSKLLVGTWKYEDNKIELCDVSNGKYTIFGCVDENDEMNIVFDNSPRILLNTSDLEINQKEKVIITEDDFSLFNKGDNNYTVEVNNQIVSLPYTIDYKKYKESNVSIVYTLENANSVTRNINIIVDAVNADTSGANYPDISDNMIPVKWNGTSWVKADIFNEEGINKWYDYDEKMWANAVTVTSDTRDGYLNNDDGTVIDIDDIVQMYVWIPRYKYNMSSDNYHTNTAGTFNITFEKEKEITGINDLSTPCTGDTYCIHPAFVTFNSRGLWIGKFESSGSHDNIKIKPNVTSLSGIIDDCFLAGFDINKENNNSGFDSNNDVIDPHMIKNTEWGAVMYLTDSSYGKNSEIWINNNKNFKTGCAGDSVSAAETSNCNQYNTEKGVNASTTGNIYGIYDMSGGRNDYTASNYGNFYNSSAGAMAATDFLRSYQGTSYVENIHYYDLSTKGMAIYETSSNMWDRDLWSVNSTWSPMSRAYLSFNGDYSVNTSKHFPVLIRGGIYSNTVYSGGYSYHYSSAYNSYDGILRVALIFK